MIIFCLIFCLWWFLGQFAWYLAARKILEDSQLFFIDLVLLPICIIGGPVSFVTVISVIGLYGDIIKYLDEMAGKIEN
jgi:hypothetical protein